MTNEELGKIFDNSVISLNQTLESQKMYKDLNASVDPKDIKKLIFPNFVKIFNLPEDGVMLPILPDLDILSIDGLVSTNKDITTGKKSKNPDPHLIQYITKYVNGEVAISRNEADNTGKSDFIKKQSIIIKENQGTQNTDQNLFLLAGNSGLTHGSQSGTLITSENKGYAFDLLSNVSVGGVNDLLFDKKSLFTFPIYNSSEIKNGLVVINPKIIEDKIDISKIKKDVGKTNYINEFITVIDKNQSEGDADKKLFLLTHDANLTLGNNTIDLSYNFDRDNLFTDPMYDNKDLIIVNNTGNTDEVPAEAIYNGGKIKYVKELADDSFILTDNSLNARYFGQNNKSTNITNLLFNGEELFKDNLNHIKPRYQPRNKLFTPENNNNISINENTFDHYRFKDVQNNINIKAINYDGKEIGNNILVSSKGVHIGSGLAYTEGALFKNINTPDSMVPGYTENKDRTISYTDTIPTRNAKGMFNNITNPQPGAFSGSIEITNKNNNMLKKHIVADLVPEENRKFIDTKLGIMRSGNEIELKRELNIVKINDEEIKVEAATKLEIKPQYYIDKEIIDYKTNDGKITGEIEKTTYLGPTIAFNADVDDDNTRFDPYGTNGSERNKQLNFDEDGQITTIKKDEFHRKIANKHNILFHKNYGGETPEPSKLDFGMGKIIVLRNASETADSNGNWNYNIPFQFSPELTGESRSANWSSHTALGRTNDYFIWSNTSSRTMQLRATYAIIAPEAKDPAWFKDGNKKNAIYGAWGDYWTETNISGILAKYRKLLLPENYTPNKALSDGNRLSPPIVIISFGTDLDLKFSDSAGNKSRWLVSDVNIDTRLEAGWTSAKNPRMYEISLTLKEVAPSWRSYQTHAQIDRR